MSRYWKQKEKRVRNSLSSKKLPSNLKKTKKVEKYWGEEEFNSALSSLKEPLNKFAKEMERELARIETPPLSYFTDLVRKTMATTKKVFIIETFIFITVALAFLTMVGYILRAGYLLPVAIFFETATLLLPIVILFAPVYRRKEVQER